MILQLTKENGSLLKQLFTLSSVSGGIDCSVCSFAIDVLKNYLLQKNGFEKFYALLEDICHFTKIDNKTEFAVTDEGIRKAKYTFDDKSSNVVTVNVTAVPEVAVLTSALLTFATTVPFTAVTEILFGSSLVYVAVATALLTMPAFTASTLMVVVASIVTELPCVLDVVGVVPSVV